VGFDKYTKIVELRKIPLLKYVYIFVLSKYEE